MQLHLYVLDEHGMPVRTRSRDAWEHWMLNTTNRFIATTQVGRDVRVTTVFIGHEDEGRHGHLWETIVSGGDLDGECRTSPTKEDALAAHAQVVALIKKKAP